MGYGSARPVLPHGQEWLCYDAPQMTYYERNLPHWQPHHAEIFLTWRLCGSLPAEVVARLRLERVAGRQFARAERFLEKNSAGPLWLQDRRIAELVEATLLRGDKELGQYSLIAYVVMPNHVHLLIEPRDPIGRITNGLKGVSAREANRVLGRTGQPFWQDESFDHWVRTPGERSKIISYIEHNPVKAKLCARPVEWLWSSAGRRTSVGALDPSKL